MSTKVPTALLSRTAPKILPRAIKKVQRFFRLTRNEVDLIYNLAKVADPDGGETLEFVRLAESAPRTFIKLAPALFSFPCLDHHRVSWTPNERQTIAVENRAWAVAKCGNPELAVEVFTRVELELPEVFADIFRALILDSDQNETELIRTIFCALQKKPSFNVQDVFGLIEKKIEHKFRDDNVARIEREKVLQSYERISSLTSASP